MSTLRELKSKEAKIRAALGVVRREFQEKLNERAKKKCPLKVGEIIERKTTWGYRSKRTRTQRVKITRIRGEDSHRGYCLYGVNIRKNGTEGQQEKHLYEWDWDIEGIVKERDANKKDKNR